MNKYGPLAQEKVGKAMHEMHEGRLKSGSSGKKSNEQETGSRDRIIRST